MPRTAATKTAAKTARKMPVKATRTRSAAPAKSKMNALTLLIDDHKKVQKMFDQFEKLKEDDDNEAKQMLVEMACAALTIHAQIEEEIFYPAVREVLDEQDLLDEATVEHASAKQLIAELESMQPGDDLYAAKFTVLGEYVKHNVEEEEKEMFPKVKKAKLDLVAIGEQLMQRKMALREELGLGDEAVEEESAPKKRAASKSSSKKKTLH